MKFVAWDATTLVPARTRTSPKDMGESGAVGAAAAGERVDTRAAHRYQRRQIGLRTGPGRNKRLAPLLEVKNLHTEFRTGAGIVRAVDGVSYTVDPGETVAVVGESGSGKSVTAMSVLRLIPNPPGRVTGGEVWFDGRDLLKLSEEEMRQVRGGEIGMIFQEPMTSLNPVLTIERQITETLEEHRGTSPEAAHARAVELLRLVGISDAERRLRQYPH